MKFFYLAACSTCQRIMKEIGIEDRSDIELREIKTAPMKSTEITSMKKLAGSYESLFSRRAMKYKSMGLKEKALSEADYKKLILDEYTFLKRPVLLDDDKVYVGNSKKVVQAMKDHLSS